MRAHAFLKWQKVHLYFSRRSEISTRNWSPKIWSTTVEFLNLLEIKAWATAIIIVSLMIKFRITSILSNKKHDIVDFNACLFFLFRILSIISDRFGRRGRIRLQLHSFTTYYILTVKWYLEYIFLRFSVVR